MTIKKKLVKRKDLKVFFSAVIQTNVLQIIDFWRFQKIEAIMDVPYILYSSINNVVQSV